MTLLPGERVRGRWSGRIGRVYGFTDGGQGPRYFMDREKGPRYLVEWDSGLRDDVPARLLESIERKGEQQDMSKFNVGDRVVASKAEQTESYLTAEQRIVNLEVAITALARDNTAQKRRAKQLREGPQSFEKRIAAIERKLETLKPAFPPTAEAYGERLDALEAQLAERRSANEERLKEFEHHVATVHSLMLGYHPHNPQAPMHAAECDDFGEPMPVNPIGRYRMTEQLPESYTIEIEAETVDKAYEVMRRLVDEREAA